MSIRWDTRNKRWRYEFDRYIQGRRHRLSRLLPRGWSQAQADAYDRTEGARNASCWEDSPAHFHPPGATTARSTASAWRTSSSVMSRQAEARGWIWRIPISGT